MEVYNFLVEVLNTLWGDDLYNLFFIIAWLILLFFLKDKYKKAEYVWYSLIVFVGIMNPISVFIGEKLWGVSVAYFCRLFSSIQIFVIIAYGCVIILSRVKRSRKPIVLVMMIAIIVLGGESIYAQPWVRKADNFEKIPSEIIEISNAFEDMGDVIVAVPNSLNAYLRQYDTSIHMLTKRDSDSELTNQIQSLYPDIGYIENELRNAGGGYVIVYNQPTVREQFEKAGYDIWYRMEDYLIYYIS